MFGVCSLLAVAFQLRIVFPLRLFVSVIVHVHVVGMPAGPNRIYHDQIKRLRWYVGSETNMTFVKFTGSMEADSAAHPRALLDAVKGEANRQLSDEGFLPSHHQRGAIVFPCSNQQHVQIMCTQTKWRGKSPCMGS